MSISEVFGEFRTGKTQLCHTMCVTAQLPSSMGGGNGKVAYIDTEGTLYVFIYMSLTFQADLSALLPLPNVLESTQKLHWTILFLQEPIRMSNKYISSQVHFLHKMTNKIFRYCSENGRRTFHTFDSRFSDCIVQVFFSQKNLSVRVDFSGRGELAERQQKLGQMLSKLMKVAEEFNVAVLITNQGSVLYKTY